MNLTITESERDTLITALNMALDDVELYIACDELAEAFDREFNPDEKREPFTSKSKRDKENILALLQRIKTL